MAQEGLLHSFMKVSPSYGVSSLFLCALFCFRSVARLWSFSRHERDGGGLRRFHGGRLLPAVSVVWGAGGRVPGGGHREGEVVVGATHGSERFGDLGRAPEA